MEELRKDEPRLFEMKDYMGPDRGLCRDDEERLKSFIEDAHAIGVPRSRSRCASDIQEYVLQANLEVPFKKDKPGK